MSYVIALVGNKGGAGKTTLCVNLAKALAQKHSVVVLDADPQQSSLQWYEIAQREAPFEVIGACVDTQEILDDKLETCTYCLIDCPPSVHSSEMQQALRNANLAIIPVQPSPLDLWATVHVEKAVTMASNQNPHLKVLLLINQFESRTQLSQLMHRALAELSMPTAKTFIKRRVIYRKSFLEGKTVHDMGRAGVAASDEIHQLIQEMERHL